MSDESRLAAEQRARVLIDRQLVHAGWHAQDRSSMSLFAGQGVVVREVVMAAGHGRADYLLYVDKAAGVEWQSAKYAEGRPAETRLRALTVDGRLPFVFEANGTETHFTNGYDPDPRARRFAGFPQPATLARLVREAEYITSVRLDWTSGR